MRKHIYALSVAILLLATGCGNSGALESSTTDDSISSVSEATEEAPEENNPTFTISSNNLGSSDTSGNFYLTINYGNIGRVEYDVQYDNSGEYAGTFVYIYLENGEVVDDFITKANVPIDTADVTYVAENMYFCFLMDNGLEGFDKSLEQTAMYEKLCEKYNLKVQATVSEDIGLYLLAEPSTYSLSVGETTSIVIKHKPGGYEGTYIYESVTPLIAAVDSSGVITGVSAGEATISVKTEDGNHSCQFVITVT